jgi:nitroreductase
VHLVKQNEADRADAALFPAIRNRRTYRKRFKPQYVPENILNELTAAVRKEGAWIKMIDTQEIRHQVASLVTEGDAIQWANASWRRELAAWMHPRRKNDGLVVPGMIAPVAKIVMRTFDMGNGVGAKDKQLAEESPVLAVLGTARDDVGNWLAIGQALQRLLLSANCHGLQASYLNQPIQVAALRPKLQHLINAEGFPQILLRLGYPLEDLPPTPRRSLDEVIE